MMNYVDIGKRIALLRKEKGFTGEKLAELLGVSPQAVSKWENGKCLPETALLPSIAETFGCTIDALLMPKELLILEAMYTDGQTSVDVTTAVNSLVYNNRLDISITPRFPYASIQSDRLKVLTVKYQTPEGTYYAFAPQNETLCLDLSAGLVNDNGFKIVGAYYGNVEEYRSVMQKIKHYDFFNWNSIHASQETFPSATASDRAEFLTIVYLNKNGIHTISCAEDDTLYFTDDRSGLYCKDHDCRFLPGVIRLDWEEGMDCPWAGSLYAALKYMGESYTYEQIMGLSGACYRTCFTDVWDWSCNDALVAFDYAKYLFQATGYAPVWADRVEKDQRKAERQRIVRDIQCGRPVLAINLRVAPEWGVITGYTNGGEEFLCRTYFDKPVFDEHAEDVNFRRDTGGYLPNDWWPFIILHFGEKTPAPSPYESLMASLRALADSVNAEPNRGYRQGRDAYEAWVGALSKDRDFSYEVDRDGAQRRLGVNDSMLLTLIDARRCAASYLSESAWLLPEGKREALLKIAGNYTIMTKKFLEFRNRTKFDSSAEITYNMMRANGVSTPEARKEQSALLKQALSLEEENVRLAESIL